MAPNKAVGGIVHSTCYNSANVQNINLKLGMEIGIMILMITIMDSCQQPTEIAITKPIFRYLFLLC